MVERHRACLDVHLILRRGDHVLLGQRRNTGFGDGCWHPPSGHIEEDEPATVAVIREAAEETGLHLDPTALRLVHLMHHRTNQPRIALFFEATTWTGKATNPEPHKCAGWQWFPLSTLPDPMIDYAAEALAHYRTSAIYAEHGWNSPGDPRAGR